MTRDELIANMAFGISAYFGENDDPEDAAKAALAQIEAMGCVVVEAAAVEVMRNDLRQALGATYDLTGRFSIGKARREKSDA